MSYSPPPYGPYSYYEVVSAFRKSIKLNDQQNAIFWLQVMIDFGDKAGKKTAAKQLWIMAAEDCMDQDVTMRAGLVYQMIDVVGETDQLYFLTVQMCEAPKWWETDHGRRVTEMWAKAEGDVRRDKAAMAVGGKLSHEVPSYAKDRHTSYGWETMKKFGWWDDRFSGTWMGRLKSAYMHLKLGRRLTADDFPDEGYVDYWDERVRLQGLDLTDDDVKFGIGQIRTSDGKQLTLGPKWATEHFGGQQDLFDLPPEGGPGE